MSMDSSEARPSVFEGPAPALATKVGNTHGSSSRSSGSSTPSATPAFPGQSKTPAGNQQMALEDGNAQYASVQRLDASVANWQSVPTASSTFVKHMEESGSSRSSSNEEVALKRLHQFHADHSLGTNSSPAASPDLSARGSGMRNSDKDRSQKIGGSPSITADGGTLGKRKVSARSRTPSSEKSSQPDAYSRSTMIQAVEPEPTAKRRKLSDADASRNTLSSLAGPVGLKSSAGFPFKSNPNEEMDGESKLKLNGNGNGLISEASRKDPGDFKVLDDVRLLYFPENVEDRHLGHLYYRGAKMRDKTSADSSNLELFLLPSFDSSHLYATIEIRIAAEYLTMNNNLAVRYNSVWGTDVYTDDSDIVSALFHSGLYIPVDAPVASPVDGSLRETNSLQNTQVIGKFEGSFVRLHVHHPSFYLDERRRLPKPSVNPVIPKMNPAYEGTAWRVPLHDVAVTLRILPRLKRYTGTLRNGVSSRSWGASHEGESFRVEKIELLDRTTPAPSRGRKSVAARWCESACVLGIGGGRNNTRVERAKDAVFIEPIGQADGSRYRKDQSSWTRTGIAFGGLSGTGSAFLASPQLRSFVFNAGVTTGVRWPSGETESNGVESEDEVHERRDLALVRDELGRLWGTRCQSRFDDEESDQLGFKSPQRSSRSPRYGCRWTDPHDGWSRSANVYGWRMHTSGEGDTDNHSTCLMDPSETVTFVFSTLTGQPCVKYAVRWLMDWPRSLQDLLADISPTTEVSGPTSFLPGSVTDIVHSFTFDELKRMRKWAYWRIRITRDILCLENRFGRRVEVSLTAGGAGLPPRETFAIAFDRDGSGNLSTLHAGLADLHWVPEGLQLLGRQEQLFRYLSLGAKERSTSGRNNEMNGARSNN
ncbi:histone deacetylation protein Rxt3-domain-containing protein [Zopfochytrium polystomum]|nr:histone deacetylation protein Rxt3-domain-containing protein [Zopfochytrium polystomum]